MMLERLKGEWMGLRATDKLAKLEGFEQQTNQYFCLFHVHFRQLQWFIMLQHLINAEDILQNEILNISLSGFYTCKEKHFSNFNYSNQTA